MPKSVQKSSDEGLIPIILDTIVQREVQIPPSQRYKIGDSIDNYKGVPVFYNGAILNVSARNLTSDGYNLGLEYQCVEFVKRFYYVRLNHKMPYSYGDAKDFFDPKLADGAFNAQRNLIQCQNFGKFKPQPQDIVVWRGDKRNPYGHVAILSDTSRYEVEIVQQNGGKDAPSRLKIPLAYYQGKWKICGLNIVGWLRKRENTK